MKVPWRLCVCILRDAASDACQSYKTKGFIRHDIYTTQYLYTFHLNKN